ncbi:MAG: tetratricopeptide repeat protein, partial [Planctomycetes bacterium]|nr:tetratricopeptide repeat protein [Planctomycetota bacterium]
QADALDATRDQDPSNEDQFAQAMEKARAIDATDPRLAMVEASGKIRSGIEGIRKAGNLSKEELRQRVLDSRLAAAELLKKSLEKHASDSSLVTNLAGVLLASEKRGDALEVLQKGAEASPGAADIHHALAAYFLEELAGAKKDAPAEERKALIERGLKHAERAIELDKAMFETYAVRAEYLQLQAQADGTFDADRLKKQAAILDTFVKAQEDTVRLRSLRAVINTGPKALLIASAFDLSRRYYALARDDAERKAALEYAKRFLDDSRRMFPDLIYPPLMEAWLAQIAGDTTTAIQAYKRAEERAGLQNTMYRRQAKEQLALLLSNDAPGLALRYASEAIDLTTEVGLPLPRRMALVRAQLLNSLDRPRETLAFLDIVDRTFPGDFEFQALRARANVMLGNKSEAIASLQQQDTPVAKLEIARISAFKGEFKTAMENLREFLKERPFDREGLKLLVQVSNREETRAEGLRILDEIAPKASDDVQKRTVEGYKLILGATDAADRDNKMLEMIATLPDECDRTRDYFNFHASRQNYAKAAEYLSALIKCQGEDNEEVLRAAFELKLALNKPDEAEPYLISLTKKNADRAGGSVLRGQFKMAKGDLPGALAEYRAAERDLPSDVRLKIQIAEILRRSAPPQLEEALESLRQASELDPRDFDVNRMMYVVHEQLGRSSEGIAYLSRAAAVNPNDPFVQERMRLVEESQDPKKGIAWREPLRKERPDDVANLLRLSELYNQAGEADKADECISAALVAAPTAYPVASAAARHYAQRKNRSGGESALRNFVSAATGGAKVEGQVLLGKFYESLNDSASAATAYQEAERRVDEWLKDDAALRARGRVLVQVALADFYARMKQTPAVIDAYRAALANVRPEMAASVQELRGKLIRALMSNVQFGDAEKEIESYRRDYPKDMRANALKAEWILRQKNDDASLQQAAELLSQVLRDSPDDLWSLLARAKIASSQRRFKEAQADLLRIKAIDRKAFNFEPRLELARVLENQDSYQLAEAELREIIADRDNDNEAAMSLVNFLVRIDQARKAEAYAAERIAKTPEDAFWHYQLARLLNRRGERAAALKPLARALELVKGADGRFLEEWVDTMVALGQARDVLVAVPKMNPEGMTTRATIAIAGAHAKLKQQKEAVALVREAFVSVSGQSLDEVELAVRKAATFLSMQEVLDSLKEVTVQSDAALGQEGRLRLLIIRARGLLQIGGDAAMKEAETLTDEVVANTQPRLRALMSSALHTKALCRDFSGDYKTALSFYERALQFTPEDGTLLNNIAFVLADKLDRPAEALPYIERAARNGPLTSNLLDTLGFVHYRNNGFVRAESVLREAIRIDSKSPAPHLHLAQVLIKTDRTGEARTILNAVLELTKDEKDNKFRKQAEQELEKIGK